MLCEAEHCITFVNLEEKFSKHVLVEILTRAVTKLHLLVLPTKLKDGDTIEKGNLYGILNAWKKEKMLFYPDVEFNDNDEEFTVSINGGEEVRIDIDKSTEEKFNSFIAEFNDDDQLNKRDMKRWEIILIIIFCYT